MLDVSETFIYRSCPDSISRGWAALCKIINCSGHLTASGIPDEHEAGGPPCICRVLYDLQLVHLCAKTWNWTWHCAPQSLQSIQTILFWYNSGIGVFAISWSSLLHILDISQIDFEQTGHEYLQWCCISWTHSKCMVCPQGRTVISFIVSNRYSKHTGQLWCIALSTQQWASLINFE